MQLLFFFALKVLFTFHCPLFVRQFVLADVQLPTMHALKETAVLHNWQDTCSVFTSIEFEADGTMSDNA